MCIGDTPGGEELGSVFVEAVPDTLEVVMGEAVIGIHEEEVLSFCHLCPDIALIGDVPFCRVEKGEMRQFCGEFGGIFGGFVW